MLTAYFKSGSTETEITIVGGDLSLTNAPSSLNFGTFAIEGGSQDRQAEVVDGALTVSDLRGSGAGWHVSAQLGEFNDGALPSSVITFSNTEIASQNNLTSGSPVENPNGISLTAGGAAAGIVSAGVNQGLDVWNMNWAPENINLHVPAGSVTAGTHTAAITWTLLDGPTGLE